MTFLIDENLPARVGSVIVTRDLRFTDPNQFDLSRIGGIVIVRFPIYGKRD